ncbi:uncharacterized protein LOC129242143 [Anastrepha obliqua]|uniref:uncharacterized protein LOC129242143 n=1 Tax=Anastrepha obliqua TaxID=95512 RepID=UPI002409BA01|nr:uncharacterized protein LOC129242143 [Anastrepha obliqua]
MKSFVIFAAALVCVQAVQLPVIVSRSSESSEEEYSVLLPAKGQRPVSLPGVGVVNQPVLEAVKVKVPTYASPETKQQLITQALAARGHSAAQPLVAETTNVDQEQVLLVRERRAVPVVTTAANKMVSEATTAAGEVSTSKVTEMPRVGSVTKAPVVAAVPVGVYTFEWNHKHFSTKHTEEKNMRVLVIFTAALLCVQAVRVPYIISESSEEDYHILLPPNKKGHVNLPGVGIVNHPVIQAVKVKVPRYADPLLKQQIIEEFLAAQGLDPKGFAGQNLDAKEIKAKNVAADNLNARNFNLENLYNLGLDLQYANAPRNVATQPTEQKSTKTANEPFLLYALAPVRNRRQIEVGSSTTSPLDTTTVPDVIETSTITELPAMEGVTEMLDAVSPVSSTESPITTTLPPPAPVPLFGFGSLLPAEVSRVAFVPRIPMATPPSISTTEGPDNVPQPTIVVHNRFARAVPSNIQDHTQLTKATPVPPVPQMDLRGPKMSDLARSRKLRAAADVTVDTTPAPMDGAVVANQKNTTEPNCDIECTKFDLNPVCAFNGECYHEFANQCVMDTFLCKRPDLGFKATPGERCTMHWLKRCNAEQLKME